jgi:flagellar biosynthesis/type III secretory pathway protein FliH
MSHTPTLQLNRPIKSVSLQAAHGLPDIGQPGAHSPTSGAAIGEPGAAVIDGIQNQLNQTCEALDNLAGKLEQLQDEMIQSHREQIARLAVEIARKILVQKVKDKDYEIEAIVQEALANAPTPHGIVAHLNPDDLAACQQIQRNRPDGPFAHIELMANHSVRPAECMLETPKGMIKSLMDEQLETIALALGKAQ